MRLNTYLAVRSFWRKAVWTACGLCYLFAALFVVCILLAGTAKVIGSVEAVHTQQLEEVIANKLGAE